MKRTKGFTLIELLIVITIIVAITSVIMLNINEARARSRDGKRVADINSIQLALALYLNVHGNYPVGNNINALTVLTTENFIGAIPTDPTNNATFRYNYTSLSPGSSYCVSAVLEKDSMYRDTSVANPTATCEGQGPYSYIYKVIK
jgi:prepilin-type N-terminal cleavage/methylation domain-containing protein